MKALVRHRYGSLAELALADLPEPVPGPREVLVRVRAVSLNTSDVESLTGTPFYARVLGLMRPRFPVLGTDVAGVVEKVGPGVSRFAPGDEVLGDIMGHGGALAELAIAPESRLFIKPPQLGFDVAACLPQAGAIAWQGIVQIGRARPGERVLVNGGGGGSGTLAIQLAKELGCVVTGVDNSHKQALMRQVGADHTVDYTTTDFVTLGERYDVILDLVASRTLSEISRVLSPTGRYFMVGGPMKRLFAVLATGWVRGSRQQKLRLLAVDTNGGVAELLDRCVAGTLRPSIGGRYPLERAHEAIALVMEGRALGKLVVELV